jgi:hypothetical protein
MVSYEMHFVAASEKPQQSQPAATILTPGYWLNWKNCWVPFRGLVTAFCPLTTAGALDIGLQNTGGARFVADCLGKIGKNVAVNFLEQRRSRRRKSKPRH